MERMDVSDRPLTERAARLRAFADRLRRVPASGATVHDMAALIGLATLAADYADQLAAGSVPPTDWRAPWLAQAEEQLEVYSRDGLAGWRRVYRR